MKQWLIQEILVIKVQEEHKVLKEVQQKNQIQKEVHVKKQLLNVINNRIKYEIASEFCSNIEDNSINDISYRVRKNLI